MTPPTAPQPRTWGFFYADNPARIAHTTQPQALSHTAKPQAHTATYSPVYGCFFHDFFDFSVDCCILYLTFLFI